MIEDSNETRRGNCRGCGNEIDPETCWCGDDMKAHSIASGHNGVPMGCDCMRHVSALEVTQLTAERNIAIATCNAQAVQIDRLKAELAELRKKT